MKERKKETFTNYASKAESRKTHKTSKTITQTNAHRLIRSFNAFSEERLRSLRMKKGTSYEPVKPELRRLSIVMNERERLLVITNSTNDPVCLVATVNALPIN